MSKSVGDIGESLAVEYLSKHKFEILGRNYRTKRGEIDIVAKRSNTIIFVEVKYREDQGFGAAFEYVTKDKLTKIKKAAIDYLMNNKQLDADWRVDIVSIDRRDGAVIHFENVCVEGLE